ncbi:MAG: type II toxin-antitoxin system VapC family toxin [Solirubrobacteraceae bacterium]
MRLLLDTHAVLWWLAGSERLSTSARAAITGGECRVSVLSAVEVTLKKARGRLDAPDLIDVLPDQWSWLSLLPAHASRLANLPQHHRDPFDRLLVAQALEEGLVVVSCDEQMRRYGVPVLW